MRRRHSRSAVRGASAMAAAAAVAEAAGVAAAPLPGAPSHGELPEGYGEGAGAWREEKDASAMGAEAVGDSEEDGEDVFEVEKILDVKTEGVRERRGRGAWDAPGGGPPAWGRCSPGRVHVKASGPRPRHLCP